MVQAPDRPLPWDVSIYAAANGHACAIAGQVRGVSLGRLEGGHFRAYARGTTGACGNLERLPLISDMLLIGGPQPRSILFGRTQASVEQVVVEARDERHVATPARGAFVLVFEGLLRPQDLDVRPVDSRARSPE